VGGHAANCPVDTGLVYIPYLISKVQPEDKTGSEVQRKPRQARVTVLSQEDYPSLHGRNKC
jgi:hypothetical protein